MKTQKPQIKFVYMGPIERSKWCDGYSENGNTYPWVTKREAQAQAKARGAKAVFVGR